MVTKKEQIKNLEREFVNLLGFLQKKYPKVFEDYKSHLVTDTDLEFIELLKY